MWIHGRYLSEWMLSARVSMLRILCWFILKSLCFSLSLSICTFFRQNFTFIRISFGYPSQGSVCLISSSWFMDSQAFLFFAFLEHSHPVYLLRQMWHSRFICLMYHQLVWSNVICAVRIWVVWCLARDQVISKGRDDGGCFISSPSSKSHFHSSGFVNVILILPLPSPEISQVHLL
jgi:hypothetical protein